MEGKSNLKRIGCGCGVAILIFFVIMGIVAFFLFGAMNSKEYKIGDDSVSSITVIVGERKASGFYTNTSFDGTKKEYSYSEVENVKEDVIAYGLYLRDEEGYTSLKAVDLEEPSGEMQFGKNSVDEGQAVVITIDYREDGYTITMWKTKGEID